MDIGLDTEIAKEVSRFIGDRKPGEVLQWLYHASSSDGNDHLGVLAGLLPSDQNSAVELVDRMNLPPLESVVILMAVLRKLRSKEEWIHYNICKHLSPLLRA